MSFPLICQHMPQNTIQERRVDVPRSITSVTQHFSDISPNVQKFRPTIKTVLACSLTAVMEEEIIAIAAKKHNEKSINIEYEYRNFYSRK